MDGVIHVHIVLLVGALGIAQLRQRLNRIATRDSTEFHSAHVQDIVSFKAARSEILEEGLGHLGQPTARE